MVPHQLYQFANGPVETSRIIHPKKTTESCPSETIRRAFPGETQWLLDNQKRTQLQNQFRIRDTLQSARRTLRLDCSEDLPESSPLYLPVQKWQAIKTSANRACLDF